MRIVRRPAVQGHAVPSTAHRPQGPFPSEVLAPNPVVSVEIDDPDPRENAQNGYRAPGYVRCTLCSEVMTIEETDAHRCGNG